MRIAIAGIATESCTFSPLPTRLADFRLMRPGAPEFAALYPFLADYPDVEFLGTLTAKAMPGGPVEAAAYSAIKDEILEKIAALLPLNGIYLDMHGAMHVLGMQDAEGDFYAALRALVGADCLLAASYDLHGNVSERIMAHLNIITGYRTAPHIDYLQTRARAVALLTRCLRDNIRPRKAFVKIPLGLPGEKTSTEWEPGKSIYAAIPAEIDGKRVLDATLQVGYVWADEPRMTACAIALGQDEAAIAAAAARLAQGFWQRRADFRFGVEALSVDDCINRALAAEAQPVLISDSGDNPTAGGVGDISYFLERALALNPPNLLYASIADAAAVKICQAAGSGTEVSLELGGKLDTANGCALPVRGIVETLKADEMNPQAVLKIGGIRVILTAKRTAFHRRQQFLELNLLPEAQRIIAVKIGYLVPELKAMAKEAYLALSPGAVNQDITALPFHQIQRPCYPFDAAMEWSPTVQMY